MYLDKDADKVFNFLMVLFVWYVVIGGFLQFGSLKSAEQLESTCDRRATVSFCVILDAGMPSGAHIPGIETLPFPPFFEASRQLDISHL